MSEKSYWALLKETLFKDAKNPDERDLMIKYKSALMSIRIVLVAMVLLSAQYSLRHQGGNDWYLYAAMLIGAFAMLGSLLYYRIKM